MREVASRGAGRALGSAGLALVGMLVPATAADAPRCVLERGPARAVVKVIDGETLALDDGSQVRLIGALPPRALDGGADEAAWPLAQEATDELKRLALGKSVELGFAGSKYDRYGRLLAQVFIRGGDERLWLQGAMLRTGYARAYALPGSTACLGDLVAAEGQALDARAALWGHAAYQVRSAGRHQELLRFRSTYQIVEGQVLSVADVRGQIYLNFGGNWREDFTVAVRPRQKRAFDESKFDFNALKGRRVRVRGWIERRAGPMIELYHPAQIEVLQ